MEQNEKDFTCQQVVTLREWANFLQDAKATRRFVKRVGVWGGLVLGGWAASRWEQVIAWVTQ